MYIYQINLPFVEEVAFVTKSQVRVELPLLLWVHKKRAFESGHSFSKQSSRWMNHRPNHSIRRAWIPRCRGCISFSKDVSIEPLGFSTLSTRFLLPLWNLSCRSPSNLGRSQAWDYKVFPILLNLIYDLPYFPDRERLFVCCEWSSRWSLGKRSLKGDR